MGGWKTPESYARIEIAMHEKNIADFIKKGIFNLIRKFKIELGISIRKPGENSK